METEPATTTRPLSFADVAQVIARYDAQLRENQSEQWDTVALVADCDQGLWGALGEVYDTAGMMGLIVGEGSPEERALDAAFAALQATLRAEVAAR